jgi:hypothetical protein
MNRKQSRTISVLDLLYLIAALALGFAWMRRFQNSEAGGESYPYADRWAGPLAGFQHGVELANWWVESLSYCVAVVTVALFLRRLWGTPRRRLRRLFRHPGVVAAGAVTLTVILDLSHAGIEILGGFLEDPSESPWRRTYLLISNDHACLAIFIAWALLAASGRWRSENGLIERVGTALGLFWLFAGFFGYLVRSLPGLLSPSWLSVE